MATKPHVSHERAPLEGHARLVFERLGYSVTYEGGALEARRDGKVVRVVAVDDGRLPRIEEGDDADKYCLATHAEEASDLKRTAEDRLPPDADWAVIGLEAEAEDDTDGYGYSYFVA